MAERNSPRRPRLLVAAAVLSLAAGLAAALAPVAGAETQVKLRLKSVSVTITASGTVSEGGRPGVFDGPYSRKVELKAVLTGKPRPGHATTTIELPPQKNLYSCSPECPQFVLSGKTTITDVVTPDDAAIAPITCTRTVPLPKTFDGRRPIGSVQIVGASRTAFGPNLALPQGLLFFASTAQPDANGCPLAAPRVNDAGYAMSQLQDGSMPVKAIKGSKTFSVGWTKFVTLDQYGGFAGLAKVTATAVFEKVG